jgi:hypothetical protein
LISNACPAAAGDGQHAVATVICLIGAAWLPLIAS